MVLIDWFHSPLLQHARFYVGGMCLLHRSEIFMSGVVSPSWCTRLKVSRGVGLEHQTINVNEILPECKVGVVENI